MAWNIKKTKSKLDDFFKRKKIEYSFIETENKYRFELCLNDAGIIIYPYVKILSDNIISFNVNVTQKESTNLYNGPINDFNVKSKFIKAFVTDDNIICLEYRFLMSEYVDETLELLIEQLFILQKEIDFL